MWSLHGLGEDLLQKVASDQSSGGAAVVSGPCERVREHSDPGLLTLVSEAHWWHACVAMRQGGPRISRSSCHAIFHHKTMCCTLAMKIVSHVLTQPHHSY